MLNRGPVRGGYIGATGKNNEILLAIKITVIGISAGLVFFCGPALAQFIRRVLGRWAYNAVAA